MQKKLLILSLLGMFVLPTISFAACPNPADPASCIAPDSSLVVAVQKIINLFFWSLIIISTIFIMIAAFNFITAQGDPAKTGAAMTAVRNAAIGLIVAVIARGLASFLANFNFGA